MLSCMPIQLLLCLVLYGLKVFLFHRPGTHKEVFCSDFVFFTIVRVKKHCVTVFRHLGSHYILRFFRNNLRDIINQSANGLMGQSIYKVWLLCKWIVRVRVFTKYLQSLSALQMVCTGRVFTKFECSANGLYGWVFTKYLQSLSALQMDCTGQGIYEV